MKSYRILWLAPVALLVLALPSATATAESPKVLQVVGVKVSGPRQAYYDKIKVLQGISKRLGVPAARVWRATLAGEGTDTIFVATEYENMAAMAAGQDKVAADPEFTKLLRDLDASGTRTVIDRSLFVDDTPQ
jgi:hypothetical protein